MNDEPEHDQTGPDLLIDFSSLDASDLKQELAKGEELPSQKTLISPDRIARLVKSVVELNDWPALIHILSCALIDPSPKRARLTLTYTLRYLFVITKGRMPRKRPVEEKPSEQ